MTTFHPACYNIWREEQRIQPFILLRSSETTSRQDSWKCLQRRGGLGDFEIGVEEVCAFFFSGSSPLGFICPCCIPQLCSSFAKQRPDVIQKNLLAQGKSMLASTVLKRAEQSLSGSTLANTAVDLHRGLSCSILRLLAV